MYCPKCHKAIDPELPKCMYCGYLNKEYDYGKDRTVDVDYKSTPLNIVSFFIPFAGLHCEYRAYQLCGGLYRYGDASDHFPGHPGRCGGHHAGQRR